MSESYRYFLSVSSQFPFCGIPLRLDTYSRCQFACRYCFASARGGAAGSARIQVADPSILARRLGRLEKGVEPRSALDEMLAARIPLHFGGMSDPFMPIELQRKTTLELLTILAEFRYPTIISTKGILAAEPQYLRLLLQPNFAVQFSITSSSDELSRIVDTGAPVTSARLSATRVLADHGVPVAIRHQPMFPTGVEDAHKLVELAVEAGARHYAVEHLKLPIEQDWQHRRSLDAAAGLDLQDYYRSRNSSRVGREWILPVADRLDTVLALKRHANTLGLTFGAADNDMLHLSDGSVCCSGADLLGLGDGYQFNFLSAVRLGLATGHVTFKSISDAWRPTRSIAQYVNSNSRQAGESIDTFIRKRWNGSANGPSPKSFVGVSESGMMDADGFKIYSISDEIRSKASVRNATLLEAIPVTN